LAGVLALSHSVYAQAPEDTGDWKAVCDEQGCRLAQSLVAPTSQTTLLLARVFDGETPTLILTVPLGVFLKSGLLMSIDGAAPRPIAFEICDALGCHAGLPMDDRLLTAFKRGLKAEVTFLDGTQEQVSLTLSLIGFTTGMERLGTVLPE